MGFDENKELTSEDVERLIDNFARNVVEQGFEGPDTILIQMFSPISRILGSMWMLINAPILEKTKNIFSNRFIYF